VREGDNFVQEYFRLVTSDRDSAWAMLAPAMQTDRASYDAWWGSIDEVGVSDISVDTDAMTVRATLTYDFKDKPTKSESRTYTLVRGDDSSLKLQGSTA